MAARRAFLLEKSHKGGGASDHFDKEMAKARIDHCPDTELFDMRMLCYSSIQYTYYLLVICTYVFNILSF